MTAPGRINSVPPIRHAPGRCHAASLLAGSADLPLGTSSSHGGLYYSGETVAPLPAQWRGFLLDQRSLRMIAVKSADPVNASPLRARYLAEAKRLEEVAKKQALSADEAADLGAILIRLGELDRALDVLQSAQRTYPKHFRLTANLGTAWHMRGDLGQASTVLRQSVQLAPGKWQKDRAAPSGPGSATPTASQGRSRSGQPVRCQMGWPGWQIPSRALAAEQRKLLTNRCHGPGPAAGPVVAPRSLPAVAVGGVGQRPWRCDHGRRP